MYDETYHAAMERITKQAGELPAMAIRVIRWIVCAKRYIYTRELQCILAMGNESLSIDEDFVPGKNFRGKTSGCVLAKKLAVSHVLQTPHPEGRASETGQEESCSC